MAFVLDPRLEKSGFFVADLGLCSVFLKNSAKTPWLVLVPRREGAVEYFDLNPADQGELIKEMSLAGKVLKEVYQADKINTAAYGNMVPQLHIHIFARFRNDAAWPKPVWAVQADEIPYTESEKDGAIEKIRARLKTLGG